MSNSKIALTSSMRSNLLTLQNTQKLFDKTQDKLSSGYKVNSAMDNPSSYFTAQSLNSRADDLGTLLDSIGQAISTLEVADQGITSLQDLISQAKSVANSARDTQNIASTKTTAQKFDMDRTRIAQLDTQITGITANDEFIIRVGESTELVGKNATTDDALCGTVFSGATAYNPAAGTGGSGSVKLGKNEYILDFATGAAATDNKMVETTKFAVGDVLKIVDASNLTMTKVVDSNGKSHIINMADAAGTAMNGNISAATGSGITFANMSEGTELVCSTAGTLTTTISDAGATAQSSSYTAAWTISKTGMEAFGDITTKSAIQIKGGSTVGQMAETMERFIGKDRISVAVEDGNLAIKSKDTSSVEATGTFADKFGLDKGTTIKMATTDTAEYLRQKINAVDGVSAEFDADGHIVISCADGDDMVISGKLAERMGADGAVTNGSNERDAYATQFNSMLGQIDQLVNDTSYKGINLLKGDNLLVNFNENRTSSLELKGVNFDSTGLGLTQAAKRWVDNASIDKSLEQITQATSMLRAQASEFGQNLSTVQIREDFTTNMINKLTTGADKLTLADTNEEAANLLALQTRQSLATTSLSLANQSAQGVLRLF